jgi:hypothetical protein
VGEVVGARGALTRKLSNPKITNPGCIVRRQTAYYTVDCNSNKDFIYIKNPMMQSIRATEVKDTRNIVFMQLSGHGLDKKDTFGKSDPYITVREFPLRRYRRF